MHSDFGLARQEVHVALSTIRSGNPDPWIRTWAASDDVTLFGAWGPIEKGHQNLVDTFRWVASRFNGGGETEVEDVVAYSSGDLAYTVGFERGDVVVDGGTSESMTIRVTHIYRRVDEEWRLVHRHADFPPTDPRPGS
jgi:ketosteroid isomerase-like protein